MILPLIQACVEGVHHFESLVEVKSSTNDIVVQKVEISTLLIQFFCLKRGTKLKLTTPYFTLILKHLFTFLLRHPRPELAESNCSLKMFRFSRFLTNVINRCRPRSLKAVSPNFRQEIPLN